MQMMPIKAINSPLTQRRIGLFVLLSAAIGFTLNLYPIYLFSELTFIFGPALSLLVAFTVGPIAGALVAIVVSSALVISWDNYYGFILFVPEAYIVGKLYQKGWNEFLAGFVFWLLASVPVAMATLVLYDASWLIVDLLGKYFANNFMYTLIASAINWFFSIPRKLKLKAQRSFTLRTQIFTILMVSMTLPIAAIALYEGKRVREDYLKEVNQSLKISADKTAQQLEHFIQSQQLVIQNHAEVLALTKSSQLYSLDKLAEFHRQNSIFSSLVIIDPEGKVHAFSPASKNLIKGMSVVDREYFIQAKQGETFISQAFRGRGFGSESIVAISAPVISATTNKIIAVLEGTLNLKKLVKIINFQEQNSDGIEQSMLVTDAANRVMFTTQGIKLELLENVDWFEVPSLKIPNFFETQCVDELVVTQYADLTNQWRVRTIHKSTYFIQYMRKVYHNLGVVLMIVVFILGSLAAFLSHRINGPIKWLLNRTQRLNIVGEIDSPVVISPYIPSELASLMRAQESAERRLRTTFEAKKLHQEKRLRAEKANEAKTYFLSAMSHELRTPLNAISGFSQLLKLDESLPQEPKELANEIYIASQHLVLLINDILDMSMIEAGKFHLKKDKVELNQCLQQTLPILESQAQARGIVLKIIPSQQPIEIVIDKLRLKQILINILSNAIKYNRYQGEVTVSLAQKDDATCVIKIEDTGMGIAADQIQSIFNKFNRLNKNSGAEGYGVGLTISQKLIELMKGKIIVESELNKGSVFSIYLPINPDINENEKLSSPDYFYLQNKQISKCSILYIEDDEVNALVMKKAMRRFPQIDLVRVPTGRAGLQAIEKAYYDFILLDIKLPDITGYEVLERLQNEYQKQYQHVFAVSANAMAEDIDKGLAVGFDEYITKPIKFDLLFGLIHQYQTK